MGSLKTVYRKNKKRGFKKLYFGKLWFSTAIPNGHLDEEN